MAVKTNTVTGWRMGIVYQRGQPVIRIAITRVNSLKGYFPTSASRARFINWTESQPRQANGLRPQKGQMGNVTNYAETERVE